LFFLLSEVAAKQLARQHAVMSMFFCRSACALVTSQGGSQAWVDMPGPGPDAFLSDYGKGGELAANNCNAGLLS
jgi:hypothetical protein